MNLSRTERWMAEAGIIALIACVIAVLGLFISAEMPLGYRLAYWIPGLLAAWLMVRLFALFGAAAAKLLGIDQAWGYLIAIPLSSAAIALGVLWSIGGADMAMGDGFTRIWPTTIAIGIGFFCLFFALYARAGYKADRVDEPDEASGSEPLKQPETALTMTDLHSHLPKGFPTIIALSVEDHYVRAHASNRNELVLMPLNEAVELMPLGEGERVHRSWWVARSAVKGHKRERRDVKLILSNDLKVPVSRDKVGELREAGWLNQGLSS